MKCLIVEHHRFSNPIRVGSHHIAHAFLERGEDVVWISHPRSPLHRTHGPLPPQVQKHEGGLLELTPRVTLPYIRWPLLDSQWWGRRWLRWGSTTRSLLEDHGAQQCDLLWLSDFTMGPLLDWIDARTVVWRFFDRLQFFSWSPYSVFTMLGHYRWRADLIIASSRVLQKDLEELGFNALYVPNGAPADDGRPIPPAERSPRVVYIGALDRWFDLPTIECWASALPDVLFELGGPNPRGLTSDLPNVIFRGPIEPDEVPQFIGGARFGIIPFKLNDLTLGVHPLKLYDYLSAGCPVLSSDLPEVQPDPAGIFTYRTPSDGLMILREHLDRPFDRSRLRRIADAHRWPARLATILDRLGLESR